MIHTCDFIYDQNLRIIVCSLHLHGLLINFNFNVAPRTRDRNYCKSGI